MYASGKSSRMINHKIVKHTQPIPQYILPVKYFAAELKKNPKLGFK